MYEQLLAKNKPAVKLPKTMSRKTSYKDLREKQMAMMEEQMSQQGYPQPPYTQRDSYYNQRGYHY